MPEVILEPHCDPPVLGDYHHLCFLCYFACRMVVVVAVVFAKMKGLILTMIEPMVPEHINCKRVCKRVSEGYHEI